MATGRMHFDKLTLALVPFITIAACVPEVEGEISFCATTY
jgi:hypothetical protein